MLLGSFPNANPHNAQVYMAMMVEEIVAANPSTTVLEAACRALRRTKTFVPTIAEVLAELRAQDEKWNDVLQANDDDVDYWEKMRTRAARKAEGRGNRCETS